MTEFLAVRGTLSIPKQRTQGAEILVQSFFLQE
jgi:hypothetical protein